MFFFILLFYVQNYRIASVDGYSHYMKQAVERKTKYNDQLDGHCCITGKLEF